MNIDPSAIEAKITDKTRAIIPVDFAGHPAELGDIQQIASANGLVVIEDACHALGAEYEGEKIGSLSDMTVFSFHPVKVVTTGEGGMVMTNSKTYYNRLRMFRNHNIMHSLKHWQYAIYEAGHNYRLTDIQCALGISQLRKLDTFIERRRQIARVYNEAFADMGNILPPAEHTYVKSAYHLYTIRVSGMDRELFIQELVNNNIGAQIHYIPAHYHPCMRGLGYNPGDFPVAEAYYEQAVSLPIFPAMTDKDVQDVIDAVKRCIRR